MLVDGGRPTTVSYISGSLPIPCGRWQFACAGGSRVLIYGGGGVVGKYASYATQFFIACWAKIFIKERKGKRNSRE
jgi:hypothetical protein